MIGIFVWSHDGYVLKSLWPSFTVSVRHCTGVLAFYKRRY